MLNLSVAPPDSREPALPVPEPEHVSVAGRLGLYFADRATYQAWAEHVDDEAPGLRTRLLTIHAPHGASAVFFQLVDRRTPLTADGVDALCDVARRVGGGQGERAAS